MTPTTFLLDLDDTLLGNNMDSFLPPYFAAIEKRLRPFANGRDVRQMLVGSVQAMVANLSPSTTNYEAFMADFTRRIGRPPDTLRPVLDTFYREDYPHLKTYTTFWPEARQVVSRLFERGVKVVIATNPLFPATAIEQRLQWAGLDGFPFTRITTLENSHFSKPDVRYYTEILACTGSAPHESWMVGNDLDNDIAPARRAGLKTWWLTQTPETAAAQPKSAKIWDMQGTLADLLAWLDREFA